MALVTLHHGDNREHLRRLIDQGVRVHSVITDPPYGLTSVSKRFGKAGAAPALSNGPTGVFKRASGGFMGQSWDASGIERDPEFWALVFEILLPGGYCLAFSSPRTGHWQACAMDIAGFTMHPFFAWAYGQGFPKAHNAAMAIDKALGVEGSRGAPKSAAHAGWIERGRMRGGEDAENHEGWQRPWMADEVAVAAAAARYIPGSPEAAQWDGWAYGAQAIKPALEPIYVGQKPYSEKNGPLNLLKHGVGAMNIDACRVGDEPDGRHPANLLHDGSDEVLALFPDSKGQLAPISSKTSRVYGNWNREGEASADRSYREQGATDFTGKPGMRREPESSAARYFNSFPPEEITCEIGNETRTDWGCESGPILYHAKAGKADRAGSKHPTVKPIGLMRWLCRLATPPGGTVLDPFAGSGSTGEAARQEGFDCILMEAEDQFAADIRRRFGLRDGSISDDVLSEFNDSESDIFAELFG